MPSSSHSLFYWWHLNSLCPSTHYWLLKPRHPSSSWRTREIGSLNLSTSTQRYVTNHLFSQFSKDLPKHLCSPNVSFSKSTWEPQGRLLCCNESLSNCILPKATELGFLVTVYSQLTSYGQSEFYWLLLRTYLPRDAFLPITAGISLTSALTGTARTDGTLGHIVLTAQDSEAKPQLSLEYMAQPLAPLKQQLTSLAHVSLQKHWAPEVLKAEKGGTCLFLREECCCYINEWGQ